MEPQVQRSLKSPRNALASFAAHDGKTKVIQPFDMGAAKHKWLRKQEDSPNGFNH